VGEKKKKGENDFFVASLGGGEGKEGDEKGQWKKKRQFRNKSRRHTATHCNSLENTATHCNTLQHTATY